MSAEDANPYGHHIVTHLTHLSEYKQQTYQGERAKVNEMAKALEAQRIAKHGK